MTKQYRDLYLLVQFLNHDFQSFDARKLKDEFSESLVQATFPARREIRQVQTRLKNELLSIIAPVDDPDLAELRARIDRIVQRTNKIGFRWRWFVELIEDSEEVADRKAGDRRLKRTLNYVPRTFSVSGATWFVGELHDIAHKGPLEHFLWWTVVKAMEYGEFAKLKICGECQRFFIQADKRQEFCTEKCRYDFHNRTRQTRGYFGEKRRQTRQLKLNRAKRLLRLGHSPVEVAAKTKLSRKLLKREGLVK